MRHYEHFVVNNEILLADPKSLKGKYGLDCPEAYESDDARFLAEAEVVFPGHPSRRAFIVSPPSEGRMTQQYGRMGQGFVIVEEEQPSGGYTELGVHESHLWRNKVEERTAKMKRTGEELGASKVAQEAICVNLESLQTRVDTLKAIVTLSEKVV